MEENYRTDTGLNFPQLKMFNRYLKDVNGYIAGGCFKNVFKDQKIRDVDIYFESEKSFRDAVEVFGRKRGIKRKYENDNCIGFWDKEGEVLVELVRSVFGPPETVLNLFDFTVVKAAYREKPEDPVETVRIDINDREVEAHQEMKSSKKEFQFIYHPKFFEHLMLNRIIIDDQIVKPVATLNRSWKYAKYGYGLCKESKIKLVGAIIERGDVDEISSDLYFGFD